METEKKDLDKQFLHWAVNWLEKQPSEIKEGVLWALKFEPHTVEVMIFHQIPKLVSRFNTEKGATFLAKAGLPGELVKVLLERFREEMAAITE